MQKAKNKNKTSSIALKTKSFLLILCDVSKYSTTGSHSSPFQIQRTNNLRVQWIWLLAGFPKQNGLELYRNKWKKNKKEVNKGWVGGACQGHAVLHKTLQVLRFRVQGLDFLFASSLDNRTGLTPNTFPPPGFTYFYIAFSRTCSKVFLTRVQSQSLNSRVMCLEGVHQLSLSDVKNADVPFPAPRDQELLFGGILEYCGTMVMTCETWKEKASGDFPKTTSSFSFWCLNSHLKTQKLTVHFFNSSVLIYLESVSEKVHVLRICPQILGKEFNH